ncbi:hypothetical protein NCS55_00878000 [Fusarium keratoplasticum]|nr:hypothetical protein NCS55_00878000 [Fusarium keratoplasticum]
MRDSNSPPRHSFLRRGLLRSKAHTRSPSPKMVDKFLRRRVDSFRAAPPGPSQYDEREERYKAQDSIAVEDLKQILDAHDKDPATELKVSGSSWDTVFDQMADAKRHHEGKTDYSSKAEVGINLMSSYINIIPDEYGLGVLKGGLALIFSATKAHRENRGRILDTFETLPDAIVTINTAHALLQPEPQDVELQGEFLSILVKDIPALVKILLGEETWYRKVVDFLLLEIPKTSTIDDILSRWGAHVVRLKAHVEKLKIRLQAKFSAKLDGIADKIEASETGITGIRDMLAENNAMQQSMMNVLMELTARIPKHVADYYPYATDVFADVATSFREEMKSRRRDKELEDELRRERDRWDRERETFSREREQWTQQREQFLRTFDNAQTRQERLEQEYLHLNNQVETLARQASETRPEPRIIVESIQLLGVLGLSMYDPWDDLDVVLRHAEHYDANLRGQAQWLVQTAEFQSWLHEDSSSVLLADGCMDAEFVSPMSGFCCGLISSFMDDTDSVVTFFFAGLHTSKALSGPTALMRSLITQLLLNSNLPKPDLGFVSEAMLEGCARRNCRTLCDVFVKLIKQVPPHMHVFCIVDGITWYEQVPWVADMHCVATMFEYLAKRTNPDHSGPIKVLLTSPTRSISIVDLTTRKQSVWWHVALANGDVHPGMAPQLVEY